MPSSGIQTTAIGLTRGIMYSVPERLTKDDFSFCFGTPLSQYITELIDSCDFVYYEIGPEELEELLLKRLSEIKYHKLISAS